MRWLVLAVWLCIAGCDRGGAPIAHWHVLADDAPDGPPARAVALPSRLLLDLPLHDTWFTLTADLPPYTGPTDLAIDCFHGPLVARAAGVSLPDLGDVAVGEHRFELPAGAHSIALRAHHDNLSSIYGFGAEPRLVARAADALPASATFDRYFAVAEIVVILAFGMVYATLYLLDRRRIADGAFAVQALAAIAMPLWQLGALQSLGRFAMPVLDLATVIVELALAACFFAMFGLGRVPRWLRAGYAAIAACSLAGIGSFAAAAVAWWLLGIVMLPLLAALVARLLPIARTGDRAGDARLMLGALASSTAIIGLTTIAASAGANWIGGWHVDSLGILIFAVAQAIILARQHVARQRSLERALGDLQRALAEQQRLVGERSRDLADALGKLAARPRELDLANQPAAHVIDGRYRVVKKLGAGGMGTVYEVVRISDDAHFALKTLRGRADPDLLARFAREAQIAAEISHANLVSVVDVGIADGQLFLVMPLVEGGTLEHPDNRRADIAWALARIAEIAHGLAALHARGIVHRDLKPANILLADGRARIADFGLATLGAGPVKDTSLDDTIAPGDADTVAPSAGPLTRAGDLFGTPLYMAPELAAGVDNVKPASDMFALGLIAYELLAQRAFATPPVLARMSNLAIPAPPPLPTAIPAAARAAIERCLDLEPSKRPAADELARTIDARG